jgi:hypothetical protein
MKNQRFVGNLFAKATMDRRVPKLSDRLRQEVAISVKRRMYSESFSLPTGTKRKVGSCLKFVRVALLTLRLPLRQAQGTLRANGVGFASAQILYMSRKVYAAVVASGWIVISAEKCGKAERGLVEQRSAIVCGRPKKTSARRRQQALLERPRQWQAQSILACS